VVAELVHDHRACSALVKPHDVGDVHPVSLAVRVGNARQRSICAGQMIRHVLDGLGRFDALAGAEFDYAMGVSLCHAATVSREARRA
jgi:hypothetical protein